MVNPIPEGRHSITPNLAVDGAADVITQVNTNTYGAVTAAEADSNIDIRPDNKITIGDGATLTADGDLDLLAGQDAKSPAPEGAGA